MRRLEHTGSHFFFDGRLGLSSTTVACLAGGLRVAVRAVSRRLQQSADAARTCSTCSMLQEDLPTPEERTDLRGLLLPVGTRIITYWLLANVAAIMYCLLGPHAIMASAD